MATGRGTILLVDDDPINLTILSEHMADAGYQQVSATNGTQAWQLLQENPGKFDAVLLDRMMPCMDGMQVLQRIKSHPKLKFLPVIMQTALAAKTDILDGLNAGAYYYLPKPYDGDTVQLIVRAAVTEFRNYQALLQRIRHTEQVLTLMDHGVFALQTLDEAKSLASLLANTCPDPETVAIGLNELIVNAIEHGNLGISYDEKTRLLEQDSWQQEVLVRQSLDQNRHKQVWIDFQRHAEEIHFCIRDDGQGFDWRQHGQIDPEHAFDCHGNGITIAREISFDRLEFKGCGNEVLAIVHLLEQ